MEGVGGNNKANKQFDGELEGAGEPQIFSLAGCRLDLSKANHFKKIVSQLFNDDARWELLASVRSEVMMVLFHLFDCKPIL